MAQVRCEICGGGLIKDGGVFQCENCGMKYSIDEIRKMLGNAPAGNMPAASPQPEFLISGTTLLRYNGSAAVPVIPDRIQAIGRSCFQGTGVVNIRIPLGVLRIEDMAFADCRNLQAVSIPRTVGYIGTGAFSGCTSLTGIELSENVRQLGGNVFRGCTAMRPALTIVPVYANPEIDLFPDAGFLQQGFCTHCAGRIEKRYSGNIGMSCMRCGRKFV